jgi:uncharacterized protein YqgV (UPF0045/DUF77 family)
VQCSIEISLHPLRDAYLAPIDAFLDALRAAPGIEIDVNDMSTHIHGDYEVVMAVLVAELRRSLEAHPGIFVLKILGIDTRLPHGR